MVTNELTPELSDLLKAACGLSPDLVRQVADYADFLGKRHGAKPHAGVASVDESDSWSQEDVRDWSRTGAERLDAIPPAVASPELCQRHLDLGD